MNITNECLKAIITRAYNDGYSIGYVIGRAEKNINDNGAVVEPSDKDDDELKTNFKRGDKVSCVGGMYSFDGIFYGETDDNYWVLDKENVAPQKIPKNGKWFLLKYGTHVDIDSLLD